MAKTTTVQMMRVDDSYNITGEKETAEGVLYPIDALPQFTFYYVKGVAYGKTVYVVIEEQTGMEFCSASTIKGLKEAIQQRLDNYSTEKLIRIITEMQAKYGKPLHRK